MIHLENYILQDNIFINPDQKSFQYSDGDAQEEYLLQVISTSNDLSTGSEELAGNIKDWSSQYHLSPKRANLLRPVSQHLKNKDVLEIGSGCGAITRFLGELGCNLLALEGSYRRAKITAERCRDLPGVQIVCDNFENFSCSDKFDYITLIGVLEYSPLFINATNPVLAVLEKIKTLLKPGGKIIIAIENKLGLKYLAGAPEDHTGIPFFGVENQYSDKTAVTFGKTELVELLKQSDMKETTFLYPFPDYKIPGILVSDAGLKNPSFDIASLLLNKYEYIQQDIYSSSFNSSLAAREVHANDLMDQLSSSFLIIAAANREDLPELPSLAYCYSTNRKKPYCKDQQFQSDPKEGNIIVIKQKLYPEFVQQPAKVNQVISNEPYFEGILLQEKLVRIISNKYWTVTQLAEWVKEYYEILKSFTSPSNEIDTIDGRYIDLTPFNIVLSKKGNFSIFDMEWDVKEHVTIEYVLFRGIYYSLGEIFFFRIPGDGIPGCLLELTSLLASAYFKVDMEKINLFRRTEKRFFSDIWVQDYKPFMPEPMRIRQADLIMQKIQLLDTLPDRFIQLEAEVKEQETKLQTKDEWISLLKKANNLLEEQQQQSEYKLLHLQNILQEQTASVNFLQEELKNAHTEMEDLKSDAHETTTLLQKELIRKTLNITREAFSDPGKTNEINQFLINNNTAAEFQRLENMIIENKTILAERQAVINDLHEEIDRQTNTIKWYQDTFEKRSLVGIVFEKFKKK